MANPNMALLVGMARAMGPLCDQVVFVGGCATGLLLDDAGLMDVRPTEDVDAIVEVASLAGYHRLASARVRLRQELPAAALGPCRRADQICPIITRPPLRPLRPAAQARQGPRRSEGSRRGVSLPQPRHRAALDRSRPLHQYFQ